MVINDDVRLQVKIERNQNISTCNDCNIQLLIGQHLAWKYLVYWGCVRRKEIIRQKSRITRAWNLDNQIPKTSWQSEVSTELHDHTVMNNNQANFSYTKQVVG